MNVKLSRTHARLILILGFIIFHSNVSLSRSNPEPKVAKASREYIQDWKEFSSSVGGFSIRFPKVPSESSGTLNVGKMIVNTHTYMVRDEFTYTIMYFDVPHINDPKVKSDLL